MRADPPTVNHVAASGPLALAKVLLSASGLDRSRALSGAALTLCVAGGQHHLHLGRRGSPNPDTCARIGHAAEHRSAEQSQVVLLHERLQLLVVADLGERAIAVAAFFQQQVHQHRFQLTQHGRVGRRRDDVLGGRRRRAKNTSGQYQHKQYTVGHSKNSKKMTTNMFQ